MLDLHSSPSGTDTSAQHSSVRFSKFRPSRPSRKWTGGRDPVRAHQPPPPNPCFSGVNRAILLDFSGRVPGAHDSTELQAPLPRNSRGRKSGGRSTPVIFTRRSRRPRRLEPSVDVVVNASGKSREDGAVADAVRHHRLARLSVPLSPTCRIFCSD